MVFRSNLRFFAAITGLIGASAVATHAAQHQLWGSFIFACLVIVGCCAYLTGLQTQTVAEPPLSTKAQEQTHEPLVVLFDQVPLPLLRYSPNTGLQAINRAARSLFRVDDLIVDPPKDLMEAVSITEAGMPRSLRIFGRTYALSISEFVTDMRTIRLISLTDIQSEISIAEATALGDLLKVLSHEIMNSLTPVANLAEIARNYLLGDESETSSRAREALELLSERATGLARFVEAYRSMAKLPEPVLLPVDIGPLLRRVVLVFERSLAAQGVSIELDVPPDCPTLYLDEVLLTQALFNVLTNAAEAVSATPKARLIKVSLECDRREMRVFVSDNGCGVPDDLQAHIFHAFVTSKPNGTGTGLNLARQIVLAQGGDLVFLGPKDGWSAVFAFILRL